MRINRKTILQAGMVLLAIGIVFALIGFTLNGFSWQTVNGFDSPWYQTVHIFGDYRSIGY